MKVGKEIIKKLVRKNSDVSGESGGEITDAMVADTKSFTCFIWVHFPKPAFTKILST